MRMERKRRRNNLRRYRQESGISRGKKILRGLLRFVRGILPYYLPTKWKQHIGICDLMHADAESWLGVRVGLVSWFTTVAWARTCKERERKKKEDDGVSHNTAPDSLSKIKMRSGLDCLTSLSPLFLSPPQLLFLSPPISPFFPFLLYTKNGYRN